MEEKPNYYAIIPANVRYDERLRDSEKILYGEITALSYKNGECWASNTYFSKLYNVTPQAISRWILDLQKCGYIIIEYEKNGREITKRIIRMVSTYIDRGINTGLIGYQQKFKDNNTSINITSNKRNIKEKFIPPTLEEVQQYANERNSKVDAVKFYEYFTEGDWKDSKGNKVSNWKQKFITWEKYADTKEEPKKVINKPWWMDATQEEIASGITEQEWKKKHNIK